MRIGVLCSGGDSPGMNACLRAITRSAISQGVEVVGFLNGYEGLLNGELYQTKNGLNRFLMQTVSGISKRGGTFLYSSRSEEFATEYGMRKAAGVLKRLEIDALIPIGGNGTLTGAHQLRQYWDGQIIGCPGTIDNDVCGTDYTIGFCTAVQTAVEAVDKLRDTATSHKRMFLVELMGRHCGYITLYTALASGCELAFIPERPLEIHEMIVKLAILKEVGKKSVMAVVAEGYHDGVVALKEKLKAAGCPFPIREVILGHLLRGGDPCPEDRILATVIGDLAVSAILKGETDKMAGMRNHLPTLVSLEEATSGHQVIPSNLIDLLERVSK